MKTNYETLVDAVIKAESCGNARHELVLEIGDTPKVLVDIGLSPLKIVIKAKTIGKIFFDHGLTQRQIERIPGMLEKPQQIYTSASHADSVVVFVYETHAGAPIMIPLARDRRVGRAVVSEVVSMYAKTGPDPRLRWKKQGYLLWEDIPEKQRPRQARHFGFNCLVWDAGRGRRADCLTSEWVSSFETPITDARRARGKMLGSRDSRNLTIGLRPPTRPRHACEIQSLLKSAAFGQR